MCVKIAVAVLLLFAATEAQAGMFGVPLGTSAPPSTLGPYSLSPVPVDSRPLGPSYTSSPGSPPLNGDIAYNRSVEHARVGVDWSSWSHGYTGDVYYTGSQNLMLTLPPETCAFVFYVEPNPMLVYAVVATAQDGTQVTQNVTGNAGASGYGFYTTDQQVISTIAIVCNGADFAVGEYYGAVPEPATLSLLALGGLAAIVRRRGR